MAPDLEDSTTGRRSALETLPNELWIEIFHALETRIDAFNLRLTCKILAKIGATYLQDLYSLA